MGNGLSPALSAEVFARTYLCWPPIVAFKFADGETTVASLVRTGGAVGNGFDTWCFSSTIIANNERRDALVGTATLALTTGAPSVK
jgi:hypothetical protein